MLTTVALVHTYAQAPSVDLAVHTVLASLYQQVLTCGYSFHQTIGLDLSSVLDDLDIVRAQDSTVVNSLTHQTTQTITYYATAARTVHRTSLAGRLARSATRHHVLDGLTAYASSDAQCGYYSVKLSVDIGGDDTSSLSSAILVTCDLVLHIVL